MNFASTTVEVLRSMLVQSGEYSEEQAVAIKGKNNLVYAIKKLEQEGKIELVEETTEPGPDLDLDVEAVEPDVYDGVGDEQGEVVPLPLVNNPKQNPEQVFEPGVEDEAWQAFVMKQFAEDEVFDGNPTVAGLRRVAEKVLGDIIESGPITIFPALGDTGNGRASVHYGIKIRWINGMGGGYMNLNKEPEIRAFSAVAEAWDGNVPEGIFRTFPLTIAETRAEGRALRKALHLKNVIAAEEIGSGEMKQEAPKEEWNPNEEATGQQLGVITTMSGRQGVDMAKLVAKYKKGDLFTKKNAVDAITELNLYQTGTTVPDDLKV